MRRLGALLIAFITGIVAIPPVFSDLGPGESVVLRVLAAVVIFGVGGFLVSWTGRGEWRLAAFCAWAPIAMGLMLLLIKLRTGETPPYWSAIVGFLFGPLVISVLGGYTASWIRERRSGNPPPSGQHPVA
jgi:hypothetical protein